MPADKPGNYQRPQLYQLFHAVGGFENFIATDISPIKQKAIQDFFGNETKTKELSEGIYTKRNSPESIAVLVGEDKPSKTRLTDIRQKAEDFLQATTSLQMYRMRLGSWSIDIKRDGNGTIIYGFGDKNYTAPEILTNIIENETGKADDKPKAEIPARQSLNRILKTYFDPKSRQYNDNPYGNFSIKDDRLDNDAPLAISLLKSIGMVSYIENNERAINRMVHVKWKNQGKVGIFSSEKQYLDFLEQLIRLTAQKS